MNEPAARRVAAAPNRNDGPRPAAREPDPGDGQGRRRGLVVVGASAGGVEALTGVVRNLPADLGAPVLVVLHVPPTAPSRLAEVLNRAGPLEVASAADGDELAPGRIYVAPPDRHMIVSDGHIHLVDGPRENGVRPAIDPLFRSAARTYRARAIGVILSGTLDDGAAGMAAIRGVGGATVVQDPDDALSDGMPRAVLDMMEPDFVMPAGRLGPVIGDLVAGRIERPRRESIDDQTALVADPTTLEPMLADFACPDCGGALAEVTVGPMTRFRCRVGHVYSPESLFGMKSGELEAGLWAALRALEESASISKRLVDRSRRLGSASMVERFQRRQTDASQRADLVRQAIASLSELSEDGGATEDLVTANPTHGEGGRHEGRIVS